MRLISKLAGTSALRVSPDEAMPPGGIAFPSLIAALRDAYKFTIFPELAQGDIPLVQVAPIGLGFQNGELEIDGVRAAISQLQLFLNGIAVSSQSTDLSDKILDNIIALLDGKFGFRLASSESQRSYISQIVVHLDQSFEERIPHLRAIQDIIFDAMHPEEDEKPKLTAKRLSFGSQIRTIMNPLQANLMDFHIERRGGVPFSQNRYFSGAPLSTEEHIAVLEKIEQTLKGWD